MENINSKKKKGRANSYGSTENTIQVNGKTVKNTEEDSGDPKRVIAI
jgi:hypothetical protein